MQVEAARVQAAEAAAAAERQREQQELKAACEAELGQMQQLLHDAVGQWRKLEAELGAKFQQSQQMLSQGQQAPEDVAYFGALTAQLQMLAPMCQQLQGQVPILSPLAHTLHLRSVLILHHVCDL